jgi:hypothetical protein
LRHWPSSKSNVHYNHKCGAVPRVTAVVRLAAALQRCRDRHGQCYAQRLTHSIYSVPTAGKGAPSGPVHCQWRWWWNRRISRGYVGHAWPRRAQPDPIRHRRPPARYRQNPSGVLRGGELALLLGATFPDIDAVVAWVPRGVLFSHCPRTSHLRPPDSLPRPLARRCV